MSMSASTMLIPGLVMAGAALLLLAAGHDFVARTVPNWLAGALALLGIALRLAKPLATNGTVAGGLIAGLAVGGVVFILAAICWRRGLMGGGDVKLLAATAIVVPPSMALNFVTAVALSGGVLAVAYLLARRFVGPPRPQRPHSLLARTLRVECWRIRRGGPLPYACAIAAGGLFILL